MSNLKKLKYTSLILAMTLILAYLIFINEDKKLSVSIGLPEINNAFYNYAELQMDLEQKFNININLVELYPQNGIALTEQTVIDNIYQKTKNGELDIIAGLTPNKMAPLVEDGLLLDMTDKILNINNLHKGVLNSSLKGGDGKIYYISPVVKNIYFVLQNKKIFDEMKVALLPLYPDYDEFLNTLTRLQSSMEQKKAAYEPIALAVKNFDEYELFIGSQFRMFGYNLETPFYKDGQFMNNEWKEFYKFFATLVRDYGKGYDEYENGIYFADNIFTNGNYAMMICNSLNMEIYSNDSFNEKFNSQSPIKLNAALPLEVSFLPNKKGEKMQNIRQSTLAISAKSYNKKVSLKIINYILSEEYALKMLEHRGEYDHFSTYPFSYPTFYNENTVATLNKAYNKNFDASKIYDTQNGSAVETYPIPEKYNEFDVVVNKALGDVYYHNKTIDESYEFILNVVK